MIKYIARKLFQVSLSTKLYHLLECFYLSTLDIDFWFIKPLQTSKCVKYTRFSTTNIHKMSHHIARNLLQLFFNDKIPM